MAMSVLTAFNPDASIASILTGGAKTVDRVLVNGQSAAQVSSANNIQALFRSRLDAAQAALNDPINNAVTGALLREQTLLVGRQERISNSTAVISKALTQIEFIKSNVRYLADQLDELEAGNISASAAATLFDNTLRTINIAVDAAQINFKDGGFTQSKNLIKSLSRETFITDFLQAAYNSDGDNIFVEGQFLGSDYFITETGGSGSVFFSDISFRNSETDTGNLVEYSSFPDTIVTTNAETGLDLTNYTSDSSITFDTASRTGITGSITRGGLGLLDAFLYDRFDNATDIDRAQTDLESAESVVLTAEADFKRDLAALNSRSSVFGSLIAGIERDIQSQIAEIEDEREANLRAAELEFAIAQFEFGILAASGNALITSIMLSQDFQASTFKQNTAAGETLVSRLVNVQA